MPLLKKLAKVVLALAAGLLVLLVLAVTVAVLVIDPDTYRPTVQRQVSGALQREIAIDRLAIAKSLYPTIDITGLRISNPPWASRRHFVTVNTASAKLNLLALLGGKLEIGSIALDGVDLLLERNSDGVGNWQFAPRRSPSSESTAPRFPGFDQVDIRDAQIGWRDVDGNVTEVRIETAEAELPTGEPLRLESTVVYRQVPVDVKLSANTSLGYALSGQPVSASIALRAVDTRANLEIGLSNLLDFSNVSINFAANGQQLDALSALIEPSLPAWGPYRVSGRADFSSGRVRVDNLRMFVDGLQGKTPLMLSRVEIESGAVLVGREVPTTVQLAGRLDETNFALDVATADLARLTAAADAIPLKSEVTLDDFRFGAEGTISLPADSWRFDLVSYVKGDVAAPLRLADMPSFKRPLSVDLAGRFAGDASQITAKELIGSVAETSIAGDLTLLHAATPRKLDAALDVGRLDLAVFEIASDEGQRASERSQQQGPPQWIESVDADIRLKVERIVGLPVTAAGISAQGSLKGGRIEVRKFRGTLADTLIAGDGGLRWKAGRAHVTANANLPLVDIAKLSGKSGSASNKTRDNKGTNKQRLDTALPLAPLRMVDADVKLSIGEIRSAPLAVDRLRVSAHLAQGRLRVPSLTVGLAGVPVQSTLILDASRDDAQLTANVSAPRVDITKLIDKLKVDVPFSGQVGQAAVTLDTRGTSLRSWVSNAKVSARVGASVVEQSGGDRELTVERASVIAGPGANTRAEILGQFGEYPVDLVMTGGRLAELLEDKPLWPKMTATLNTAFRGRPVSLSAQSAFHSLLSGRNVPVLAEMRSKNGYATVSGTIADVREPARTPLDVEVSVRGAAFRPLLRNEWVVPDLPIRVNAKANLDDGVVSLQRLRVRAGEADLSGDIRLELKDRITLTANLSGETLDMRPWIPAPVAREARPDRTSTRRARRSVSTSANDRASKLDRPFEIQAMREFDAALKLSLARLISHRFDLANLSLRADLDGGRLDASMSIAEGNSSVGLQFDGSGEYPLVVVQASTSNLNLETLKSQQLSGAPARSPQFTGKMKFAGAGTSLREVYQSANGQALISVGPGAIGTSRNPFAVQAVSADLVDTLLPGRKPDDYTQLECAAVHFSAADGVVSSPDGMAVRFKDVDILGSGAINLLTKEILFGFRAVRRRWFSFSFLDIAGDLATVRGTLDNPRVALDPGGTLITGGAAWATAGLSLVATRFWRQLRTADNPCQLIIERGRTQSDPLESLIKDLPLPDELLESLPLPGSKKKQKQEQEQEQ